MSRAIEDMHPDLRRRYYVFRDRASAVGLDYLLTCTYRSPSEQDALYAIGRTKPGKIVTRARGGESNHNYTIRGIPASMAFDIVPLRFGKPVWGTGGDGIDANPNDDDKDDLELWQAFGSIGRECGLEWAGTWKKFIEYPHFQLQSAREIMGAA